MLSMNELIDSREATAMINGGNSVWFPGSAPLPHGSGLLLETVKETVQPNAASFKRSSSTFKTIPNIMALRILIFLKSSKALYLADIAFNNVARLVRIAAASTTSFRQATSSALSDAKRIHCKIVQAM